MRLHRLSQRGLAILGTIAMCHTPSAADRVAPANRLDFAEPVRLMYQVAACGATETASPRFAAPGTQRIIAHHCRELSARYARYQRAWLAPARAFFAAVRPAALPTSVVYPFGGGDLASALAVFPDATDITTISLEAPGDVRAIETVAPHQLREDLGLTRHNIGRLFGAAHSTTKSLQASAHTRLPGTLMFALAGLAVHDMEPIGLRYFDFTEQGELHYLSELEMQAKADALRAQAPKAKAKSRYVWVEQTSAFDKVEIRFRPRNQPQAPERTFRHIVANLDDAHQAADPRLLRHLERKGQVAAMTKAASFLLWFDDFTKIREYLLSHITWMASDASGLPPSHAQRAGLTQQTYGVFTAPYFNNDGKNVKREFIEMWRKQPKRPLAFRFGYPDLARNHHLMITARPTQP